MLFALAGAAHGQTQEVKIKIRVAVLGAVPYDYVGTAESATSDKLILFSFTDRYSKISCSVIVERPLVGAEVEVSCIVPRKLAPQRPFRTVSLGWLKLINPGEEKDYEIEWGPTAVEILK